MVADGGSPVALVAMGDRLAPNSDDAGVVSLFWVRLKRAAGIVRVPGTGVRGELDGKGDLGSEMMGLETERFRREELPNGDFGKLRDGAARNVTMRLGSE